MVIGIGTNSSKTALAKESGVEGISAATDDDGIAPALLLVVRGGALCVLLLDIHSEIFNEPWGGRDVGDG